MKENYRKCVKCGSHSSTTIALHRFPKPGKTNILRCELWAKYCFPDKEWSSLKFQEQLYNNHRMLCTKHFKRSSFVDEFGKRLLRFASPDPECDKELHRPCTKLRPHELEIEQCQAMDTDDFHDAPLSPEDYTPPTHDSSSHDEHLGTSLIEDQQTVQNDQSTGTASHDPSLLDDDPIRDLGIDDSISELLNIASEHPALKKIEVDEESIEHIERDQCAALYMELLERICNAFDRIPRFVKEKLPGYDEKVYAQMAELKIKLKIVIKPLVKECVRVDDPLTLKEHCSDVSKLFGDSTCDAEFQEAEKSNFADSATSNQSTVCLEDDQEIVEKEYLEDIQETDEIENLKDIHSILKYKDIHKKEYLEDNLSKNPENTAYKDRTHPSSSVHSGYINRNLEPYVLLEDCHRSSNTLHDTALNRNLRGKPIRFIMEDNNTENSQLSSTAEGSHKYKVKIKYNVPRNELNS